MGTKAVCACALVSDSSPGLGSQLGTFSFSLLVAFFFSPFLPRSISGYLGMSPPEATLYVAPDLTAGGWNFLLRFGPACSKPGKGFSPHGFLLPLHTLAPAFLFSPCKHDYWE